MQQNVPRNVTMGDRVNRMEVVIVRKVTKENSAKKVVPLEFFQVVKTIISTGIFFSEL